MTEKIPVGILGATGMVGQKYISLLENHPWFSVNYVAASPESAGKKYSDAVSGRWHMQKDIPNGVEKLVVGNANDFNSAIDKCAFVFSALELKDKKQLMTLEEEYARAGFPVVSNASAHRWTEDVPMIIPEINPEHTDIIRDQQKNHGFNKGFIVVKPNCSIQSYLTPVYALINQGYDVSRLFITTMQAASGAGHPGVSSLDLIDNVIPYIGGEEEKTEKEPLKILGQIENGRFVNYNKLEISAHCNRVPVYDGHTACVSLELRSKIGITPPYTSQIIEKPYIDLDYFIKIWNNFRSVPQELELPSAPKRPIIYKTENDRPQPRKDRDLENGMAVCVGRLRRDPVFDIKFVGLSHNTVRGAAGGGILNAELLKAKGYI
ncbi:Aspartate-semialdehyde dehydrogenase [uncultured archaeon]|nr:Aspartate-semialdehyde dehydrogenase [uncultured archaeon]